MAGVQVGLNSLYYAVLTSDTPLGATYNSPVAIAGAINAKISPKSNTETLYCDDGPDETLPRWEKSMWSLRLKILTSTPRRSFWDTVSLAGC